MQKNTFWLNFGGLCLAVTLKIRSWSPKSNKLLILSNLYRLANLVTFHPMVHEIKCRQSLIGLILVDYVWQWPWKFDQGHQNLFSFLSCPNVISMQIWLKSASWFMRYCAHKHLLAQIWQFKSHSDLEKYVKVTKTKSALHHVPTLYPCKCGWNLPTHSWDMVHTSTIWLKFSSLSPTVTLKIRSKSPKPNQLFIMSQCYIHANLLKIHHRFMRYRANKKVSRRHWRQRQR